MPTFIEYELDDGTTVLIEAPASEVGGIVPASRGADGSVIVKAGQKFGEALEGVVGQARALRDKLDALRADEVEVSFGLKAIGEVNGFAVGKAGVEANYTVTLKWQNKAETEMERRVKRAQRRGRMRRGKRIMGTD